MASTPTSEAHAATDASPVALSNTVVNADGSLSYAGPVAPVLTPASHGLRYSTALTPAEFEHSKTRQEKAQDVMYTLNHSIMCLGFTDIFGLTLAANAYNAIRKPTKKLVIEHDHNHGYDVFKWVRDQFSGNAKDPAHVAKITQEEERRIAHDLKHAAKHEAADIAKGLKPHIHPSPAPKLTPDSSFGKAIGKAGHTSVQWLGAEAIGDLGAVPFTIFVQRHAPGFMHHVRTGMEWVFGKGFHKTTTHSAELWGKKQGLAPDSQQVKDRQHELYEYEISHLPQMAVWTVSSIALNFGAMHALHAMNPRRFEHMSLKQFGLVKGLGATMTMGVVLGLRGVTPGGAHWWDKTMGKHVVMPLAKLVGIRGEDVEHFQKTREDAAAGGSASPLLHSHGFAPVTDLADWPAAPGMPAPKSKVLASTTETAAERVQANPFAEQGVA